MIHRIAIVLFLAAAAPALAALAVQPAALDFGGQSMATTSPAQAITVTNTGATAATVNTVVASGANFTLAHDCATLAPAATCTVAISFRPLVQAGTLNVALPVSETLTVTSDQPTVTANLAGVAEKSLATHFYRSILRRAPDAPGKAFWEGEAARMQGLGASVNEAWYSMATYFYESPEYAAAARDDAGFIDDLYRTFFDRAPDGPGQSFWLGELAAGVPRGVILTNFMFSTEFRAISEGIFGVQPARPDIGVIMDFYRGRLGRLPDTPGFNNWLAKLEPALCLGDADFFAAVAALQAAIPQSPEYQARVRTDGQFVGDMYMTYLRRGGDRQGVLFWLGVAQGSPHGRADVNAAFSNSPEFGGRMTSAAAQGCILPNVGLGSGKRPKVALGAGGRPVVAYISADGTALNLVRCGNAACASGNTTRVIDTGAAGSIVNVRMIVQGDGRPLLAYRVGNLVRSAKCADADCTQATAVTILTWPEAGQDSQILPDLDLAVAPDGTPWVLHAAQESFALGLATRAYARKCVDGGLGCVAFDPAVPAPMNVERGVLALKGDGLPLLAGLRSGGNVATLRLVDACGDVACTPAVRTETQEAIGSNGGADFTTALSMTADRRAVLWYNGPSGNTQGLFAAKCLDAGCISRAAPVLADTGLFNDGATTVMPDGAPILAYHGLSPATPLRIVRCTDAACTAATARTLPGFPTARNPSVAANADGKPMLSFQDGNGMVRFANCPTSDCTP